MHNTSACGSQLYVQPRLHIHAQRLTGALCNLCASRSSRSDTHGGGIFFLLKNDIQRHARRINTPRCSALFQEAPSEMRPRLCVIERGSNGYGFNLHSERARPGQYVRAVDEDSPAERAGLQPKDRILQVPQ